MPHNMWHDTISDEWRFEYDSVQIFQITIHSNKSNIEEKYVILLTNLFFHHHGNSSKQRQWRIYKTRTLAVLLFATRIALMLGSDEHGVRSGS